MFSLQEYIKEVKKDLDTNQQRDLNWLVQALPKNPSEQEILNLKSQILRLEQNEPLAYILGYTPFYNCKIEVNKNTLIPRPETELLVDIIFKNWKNKIKKDTRFLDLCSGSGCIAIALQKALDCPIDAVDISPECCSTIKDNAQKNQVRINIFQSNMFEKISQKYDLIVSNPPYIPTFEITKLQNSVKDYEPHSALDGGTDGLDFYKKIAEQSAQYLKQNGELALEVGDNQADSVFKILHANNWIKIEIKKDYSNLARFVFANKK